MRAGYPSDTDAIMPKLTPLDVAQILKSHDTYWDSIRPRLKEFYHAYMTRFWEQSRSNAFRLIYGASTVRVETSRCYATVESYLGALYARNPAVYTTPDPRGRGTPDVAKATANMFLEQVRTQIEDATRLALIYPCSFLKLAPTTSVDPLQRVTCSAMQPWECVVDATAPSWDQQRWVGHVYQIPLEEAIERYGRQRKSFKARKYMDWIEGEYNATNLSYGAGASPELDKQANWVRILELYDLVSDRLLVYSPDYKDGTSFVFQGVKIQVGTLEDDIMDDPAAETTLDEELESYTTGIPYKTASGRPVVPIIPMYFSRDPNIPLRGYSLVERIYSQIRELNMIRTYQSQGVRRMARQWLVRSGFFDEEAQAKIAQGIDGEFINVDLQAGADLEGNIIPVPQAAIPPDIEQYAQITEADLQAAGITAPFVRGDTTGVTATENNLLQAYTSSELGRMARTRDQVITDVAKTYNIILSLILGDEAEPLALPAPSGPTMLSANDLIGDFGYWAVDGGSTPISDAAKQKDVLALVPVLEKLGAPKAEMLKELIRLFKLPDSFAQIVNEAVPTALPTGSEGPPPDPNASPGPEPQE